MWAESFTRSLRRCAPPPFSREAFGRTMFAPTNTPVTVGDISPHCGESPFSRGTRDSSALSGTSSRRGGFLLAPLQRSWQAVGLTEEFRANSVRPYGGIVFGLGKGTGRCGHRPLRIPPSAPHGAATSFFKGDERLLRPGGHLLWERRLSGEQCSPLRW